MTENWGYSDEEETEETVEDELETNDEDGDESTDGDGDGGDHRAQLVLLASGTGPLADMAKEALVAYDERVARQAAEAKALEQADTLISEGGFDWNDPAHLEVAREVEQRKLVQEEKRQIELYKKSLQADPGRPESEVNRLVAEKVAQQEALRDWQRYSDASGSDPVSRFDPVSLNPAYQEFAFQRAKDAAALEYARNELANAPDAWDVAVREARDANRAVLAGLVADSGSESTSEGGEE